MRIKFLVLLFVVAAIICCETVRSQTLKLIAEKSIDELNLDNAIQLKIQLSNRKVIGNYLAIPAIVEIDKIIKEQNVDIQKSNILIAFENYKNKKYYMYEDFSDNINAISPYILTNEKIQYQTGDTITYHTKDSKQTNEMDLSELNKQIFGSVITNLSLQFTKLTQEEKDAFFTKSSIIFPIDKTTKRWFSDFNIIKIYIIENEK